MKQIPDTQLHKILSLAITAFALAACTASPDLAAEQDVICEWGQQKFNLCEHRTQDQRVEALLAEMSLDEKIGQMTMSIWHNGVSPEIVRDFAIGAVIHTEGPVPGAAAADWVAKFDEFQRQAMQTRLGIPLLIGVDAVHGQNTFEGAVIFPHNIGMAATRNMSLVRRAAEITAIEAAGTGFNWTFSPCIAMPSSISSQATLPDWQTSPIWFGMVPRPSWTPAGPWPIWTIIW